MKCLHSFLLACSEVQVRGKINCPSERTANEELGGNIGLSVGHSW